MPSKPASALPGRATVRMRKVLRQACLRALRRITPIGCDHLARPGWLPDGSSGPHLLKVQGQAHDWCPTNCVKIRHQEIAVSHVEQLLSADRQLVRAPVISVSGGSSRRPLRVASGATDVELDIPRLRQVKVPRYRQMGELLDALQRFERVSVVEPNDRFDPALVVVLNAGVATDHPWDRFDLVRRHRDSFLPLKAAYSVAVTRSDGLAPQSAYGAQHLPYSVVQTECLSRDAACLIEVPLLDPDSAEVAEGHAVGASVSLPSAGNDASLKMDLHVGMTAQISQGVAGLVDKGGFLEGRQRGGRTIQGLNMKPTANLTQSGPIASFEFLPSRGFDVAIARSAGSGNGSIAPSDAAWPRNLRGTVRAGLNHIGVPSFVEDAELLMSEMVTNAFMHGSGDICVRMLFDNDCVRIEVRDGSRELPVLRAATPWDENGRGLFLVKAIADTWGVTDDGTTTWCSLAFPPLCHTP